MLGQHGAVSVLVGTAVSLYMAEAATAKAGGGALCGPCPPQPPHVSRQGPRTCDELCRIKRACLLQLGEYRAGMQACMAQLHEGV